MRRLRRRRWRWRRRAGAKEWPRGSLLLPPLKKTVCFFPFVCLLLLSLCLFDCNNNNSVSFSIPCKKSRNAVGARAKEEIGRAIKSREREKRRKRSSIVVPQGLESKPIRVGHPKRKKKKYVNRTLTAATDSAPVVDLRPTSWIWSRPVLPRKVCIASRMEAQRYRK